MGRQIFGTPVYRHARARRAVYVLNTDTEEGICIRRRCLSIVPPLIPELEEDPKTNGPVLLLASRGEVVTTLSFGTIRGEGEGGSSSAMQPGGPPLHTGVVVE